MEFEPDMMIRLATPRENYDQRRSMVYDYLDSLAPEDVTAGNRIADDLLAGGKPLANTVVIIPVAAAQEANNIEPAMEQYNRLGHSEPFSIVLGLNEPTAKQSSRAVRAS